ncbi:ferritin-like domain-containing protein [Mesotoga sp. UBA6090]|uniref:ferritin-like domain-containing protein n=1 Tax=Mesotoga sp. UBA6090 TaxID=1946860 RepID=UPI0025E0DF56|nr:ferritin family protein [Mesotoga sp. UBA6090]
MGAEELAVLKYALAREREGVKFYRERSKEIHVPEVKELFLQLAEMEMDHVSFISKMIEDASREDEIAIAISHIEQKNVFYSRESLELRGISVDSLAGDLSALRIAYLIEKDFEDFYKQRAQETSKKEIKDLFDMLSSWEEDHKTTLLGLYESLMKEYWSAQRFEPLY